MRLGKSPFGRWGAVGFGCACFVAVMLAPSVLVLGQPGDGTADSLAIAETLLASGRDQEALDLLLRLRRTTESARLDGLIAKCSCRLPDQRVNGQRLFNWLLKQSHYSMTSAEWTELDREARACSYELASIAFETGSGQASVEGHPKLYYFLPRLSGDAKPDPVEYGAASEPLKALPDASTSALRARIFPVDSLSEASAHARALVGGRAVTIGQGSFVIASAGRHDEAELRGFAGQLEAVQGFLERTLRLPPSNDVVIVYLMPSVEDLRAFARRAHGLVAGKGCIGYSFLRDRSIVAVTPRDRIGTLKHELVHTLVSERFPELPPWLDEGLASLYEESKFEGDRLSGLPGWRQDLLRAFGSMRPPLEELLLMDRPEFNAVGLDMERQAVNHATARTLLLYLQEQGKIAEVFAEFRPPAPLPSVVSPPRDALWRLSRILEMPEYEVERRFVAWFKSGM